MYYLDIIGTFVFAISGAHAGLYKRLDIFGATVIAFITAIGGGTLRDMMLGLQPISWLTDPNYFYTIIVAVITTFIFKDRISKIRKALFLFDSIGIAIFTVYGIDKGLSMDLNPFISVMLGTISAVFGGVFRDVIINKIPLILKKEIYASACIFGGLVYIVLINYIDKEICSYIIIGIILLLRIIAVKYKLNLPKIK